MIEETWKTYPDICYKLEIKNIEFSDNYANVTTEETAIATSKEQIGKYETAGELYSISKCEYYLEKHGQIWQIASERVIDETSTLKYGDARFIDIKLSTPKQVGASKYYTTTLKIDAPKDTVMVGSINRKTLTYPPSETPEAYRRISGNTLERVFQANKENLNETIVSSVGFTHTQNYDESKIRVYMSGLAFIMKRVNVIPKGQNEQSK